jgi:hypothetical protein
VSTTHQAPPTVVDPLLLSLPGSSETTTTVEEGQFPLALSSTSCSAELNLRRATLRRPDTPLLLGANDQTGTIQRPSLETQPRPLPELMRRAKRIFSPRRANFIWSSRRFGSTLRPHHLRSVTSANVISNRARSASMPARMPEDDVDFLSSSSGSDIPPKPPQWFKSYLPRSEQRTWTKQSLFVSPSRHHHRLRSEEKHVLRNFLGWSWRPFGKTLGLVKFFYGHRDHLTGPRVLQIFCDHDDHLAPTLSWHLSPFLEHHQSALQPVHLHHLLLFPCRWNELGGCGMMRICKASPHISQLIINTNRR